MDRLIPVLFILLIFYALSKRNRASKTVTATSYKPPKKKVKIAFDVKGTFLEERQKVLARMFTHYKQDRDKDYVVGQNGIELIAEPTNEYNPNAIQVISSSFGTMGYVPRAQTHEIDLSEPFTTLWSIEKADNGEYFAHVTLKQKQSFQPKTISNYKKE